MRRAYPGGITARGGAALWRIARAARPRVARLSFEIVRPPPRKAQNLARRGGRRGQEQGSALVERDGGALWRALPRPRIRGALTTEAGPCLLAPHARLERHFGATSALPQHYLRASSALRQRYLDATSALPQTYLRATSALPPATPAPPQRCCPQMPASPWYGPRWSSLGRAGPQQSFRITLLRF